MTLPPYIPFTEIHRRLQLIFPEGAPARQYCAREMAAKTVFTMLYVGAVEGADRHVSPKHVIKMGDLQAAKTSDAERLAYLVDVQKGGYVPLDETTTWYADNTREPIRDETLRNGLIVVGAAFDRKDIPTSSPKPRYGLHADFAALFDPKLRDAALDAAVAAWQKKHLAQGAIATVALYRAGAVADGSGVNVHFPSGESRKMAAGQSSIIAKHVIEEFAPRFLVKPAVLWLSESGNKVVARDDVLAKKLKLQIDAARNLPDIILIDASQNFLIVFVEVVATDGPITSLRRDDLLAIAAAGGYGEESVVFVTAYLDRTHPAFKKTFSELAWNSFAWLASDPNHIVALLDLSNVGAAKLHDLLALRKS